MSRAMCKLPSLPSPYMCTHTQTYTHMHTQTTHLSIYTYTRAHTDHIPAHTDTPHLHTYLDIVPHTGTHTCTQLMALNTVCTARDVSMFLGEGRTFPRPSVVLLLTSKGFCPP